MGCGKAFWSFLHSPDFADADRAVNSKTEGAQRAIAKHFLPFPGTKFSFGHLNTTVVQDEIKKCFIPGITPKLGEVVSGL